MLQNTQEFVTKGFLALVTQAAENTPAKWGKMNFQQMVEHVADFFAVSANQIQLPLITPLEQLPKYREFLLSDKQFRENTKAPTQIIGEEPLPIRSNSWLGAINFLQKQITAFETFFQQHPGAQTQHPVFGNLNFDEWIQLHYKHVTHHARQFGLME
jgi:oxepin-CoA hydrolase/3-oxo-5,6-dehydrosuberyl-CoA semialdehyde dehydrogenase